MPLGTAFGEVLGGSPRLGAASPRGICYFPVCPAAPPQPSRGASGVVGTCGSTHHTLKFPRLGPTAPCLPDTLHQIFCFLVPVWFPASRPPRCVVSPPSTPGPSETQVLTSNAVGTVSAARETVLGHPLPPGHSEHGPLLPAGRCTEPGLLSSPAVPCPRPPGSCLPESSFLPASPKRLPGLPRPLLIVPDPFRDSLWGPSLSPRRCSFDLLGPLPSPMNSNWTSLPS